VCFGCGKQWNQTKLGSICTCCPWKMSFSTSYKGSYKGKAIISPPSSWQGDVLQSTIDATIMLVVPKCVGGVGGRQSTGHLVVSRSHRPLPGGHSRLHALCSLKVKIECNSTCKNLPHNQLKFGSCLSSSKMLTPCSRDFKSFWSLGHKAILHSRVERTNKWDAKKPSTKRGWTKTCSFNCGY